LLQPTNEKQTRLEALGEVHSLVQDADHIDCPGRQSVEDDVRFARASEIAGTDVVACTATPLSARNLPNSANQVADIPVRAIHAPMVG
jgi:hypothetical protein